MYRLIVSYLLVQILCTPSAAQLLRDLPFAYDGETRTYHIYIPKRQSPAPVVILLHGNGGSADQILGFEDIAAPSQRWLQLAEQDSFILLVPNGSFAKNGARGWNDCRRNAFITPVSNDVQFITGLLEGIARQVPVDPQRIYVCGISNGGLMAHRLMQEIPQRIAAFASIIASIPALSECVESDVPVSALYMNGTADPIMPYEGGEIGSNRGLVLSTDSCIGYWKVRNGAFEQTATQHLQGEITNRRSTESIGISSYRNAENGIEVKLYRIEGGGHTEPSVLHRYQKSFLRFAGAQNHMIEYADSVWEFFKEKRR